MIILKCNDDYKIDIDVTNESNFSASVKLLGSFLKALKYFSVNKETFLRAKEQAKIALDETDYDEIPEIDKLIN